MKHSVWEGNFLHLYNVLIGFFLIQLEKPVLLYSEFLCTQNRVPKLLHSGQQSIFIGCCVHPMLEMGIYVMLEELSQ